MTAATAHTTGSTRRRTRLIAVGTAILAGAATWSAARFGFGVEPTVDGWDGGPMPVGLVQVVTVSAAAGLAGWAALAVLERLTGRARPIWAIGATLVLVASLGMPASAAVGTASAVTLIVLHLVVGIVLIPALFRSA